MTDDEFFDVTVRVRLPAEEAQGGWGGGKILAAARACLETGDEFDAAVFVRLTVTRAYEDEDA